MVVIAISGKPGAGTSTIARMLAEKLGIDYFSPGEYVKEMYEGESQTDKATKHWENKGKNKKFNEKLDDLQRDLAKKGNVVICGKLSIWALDDLADHKIWLDCDFEERVRRSAMRDKIGLEEAKQKLKEREKMEENEWKRIYGFDRSEQKQAADIVIDSSGMDQREVLKEIEKLIKNNELK